MKLLIVLFVAAAAGMLPALAVAETRVVQRGETLAGIAA